MHRNITEMFMVKSPRYWEKNMPVSFVLRTRWERKKNTLYLKSYHCSKDMTDSREPPEIVQVKKNPVQLSTQKGLRWLHVVWKRLGVSEWVDRPPPPTAPSSQTAFLWYSGGATSQSLELKREEFFIRYLRQTGGTSDWRSITSHRKWTETGICIHKGDQPL